MVTADDADVGENSRLSYVIDAGDDTGMFSIAEDGGLVTWSHLANQSLAECSWNLSIKVTDHGTEKQLWTLTSLVVVVDDCVVDNVVHTASRQSGRLLMTDWHVFVVAVIIAACVVVVGLFLTVVVALRHRRRRRRRKRTATTVRSDEDPGKEDTEGEMTLKLVASATQSSDASSDSVMSSCTSDHVVFVVDQLHAHPDMSHSLVRALQQAHQHIHSPIQVSKMCSCKKHGFWNVKKT